MPVKLLEIFSICKSEQDMSAAVVSRGNVDVSYITDLAAITVTFLMGAYIAETELFYTQDCENAAVPHEM